MVATVATCSPYDITKESFYYYKVDSTKNIFIAIRQPGLTAIRTEDGFAALVDVDRADVDTKHLVTLVQYEEVNKSNKPFIAYTFVESDDDAIELTTSYRDLVRKAGYTA